MSSAAFLDAIGSPQQRISTTNRRGERMEPAGTRVRPIYGHFVGGIIG
jgi:hypothetical protein